MPPRNPLTEDEDLLEESGGRPFGAGAPPRRTSSAAAKARGFQSLEELVGQVMPPAPETPPDLLPSPWPSSPLLTPEQTAAFRAGAGVGQGPLSALTDPGSSGIVGDVPSDVEMRGFGGLPYWASPSTNQTYVKTPEGFLPLSYLSLLPGLPGNRPFQAAQANREEWESLPWDVGPTVRREVGEFPLVLDPGIQRSLGLPGQVGGANIPQRLALEGTNPADVADYIRSTQPQTWQVHQPEWWESGPLGALISAIPVIGGIKTIAQSLPKGNIPGTLAGIASIVASAAGGMGGGGVGLGEGGLDALGATAAGERAGGFAGLTGGSVFAPPGLGTAGGIAQGAGVGSEFAGGLGGRVGSSPFPGAAEMSLGNIQLTPGEQAAGGGPFGMEPFGASAAAAATPTQSGFRDLLNRVGPEEGVSAAGGLAERLGRPSGPSAIPPAAPGVQVQPSPFGMGAEPSGAGAITSGAAPATSRVAGATSPFDMPGSRVESPEAMEARMRAQALGRMTSGQALPEYGRWA